MFANLDVNSAAMRSLLYSSVQVAFFLEKKSISRVIKNMFNFLGCTGPKNDDDMSRGKLEK